MLGLWKKELVSRRCYPFEIGAPPRFYTHLREYRFSFKSKVTSQVSL